MKAPDLVITPRGPVGLTGWRELWAARDLGRFLVWRDWKARYAQSVLGLGWAVVQPLFTMGVFTLVFGRLAGVPSEGSPYHLFSLAAVVPWTFFSNATSDAANCLSANLGMVTKVYFPRLVLPLAAVAAKLLDLGISLVLLAVVFALAGTIPAAAAWVALPAALLVVAAAALGAGLWLAALSVQYRDVRYALGFGLQLLLYASPVIYSADLVPPAWQPLYYLNPLAGAIEVVRAALLSTGPVPWFALAPGALVAVLLGVTGAWYFRRAANLVADVA